MARFISWVLTVLMKQKKRTEIKFIIIPCSFLKEKRHLTQRQHACMACLLPLAVWGLLLAAMPGSDNFQQSFGGKTLFRIPLNCNMLFPLPHESRPRPFVQKRKQPPISTKAVAMDVEVMQIISLPLPSLLPQHRLSYRCE